MLENDENQYMYIVRSGQFAGVKNTVVEMQNDEQKNIMQFLTGKIVKKNVKQSISKEVASKR